MKLIENTLCILFSLAIGFMMYYRGEADEYKHQLVVKDSLANEVYMSYKYFVHLHSDLIINKARTTEQMESFDMLDAKIDKLIFSKEP